MWVGNNFWFASGDAAETFFLSKGNLTLFWPKAVDILVQEMNTKLKDFMIKSFAPKSTQR